jgi:PPOX class probable F420-dependent enzyme
MPHVHLSDEDIRLLTEPNFGVLATVMPDGSPQATVLWVDHRDDLVWVNTATGRTKPRNLETDGRVALVVIDREDGYRAIQIRGRVVEISEEGADDHIRWLNRKYHGDDDFAFTAGERRLIVKIRPEHVIEL